MGPLQSQPTLYRLQRRPQAPQRGAGFVYTRLRRRRITPSPQQTTGKESKAGRLRNGSGSGGGYVE